MHSNHLNNKDMSSKKFNHGDQLLVTKGQLAGIVGSCVGYGDNGKVKVGISLGVNDESIAIITLPMKIVSLYSEVE